MAEFRGSYPFVALPTWIFKKQMEDSGWITCSELSVLMALQCFASGTSPEQSVYPSYTSICGYANVSKRTAVECINSLQRKGLIEKEERKDDKGQTTNLYHLKYWNHEPPVQFLHGGASAAPGTPVQNLHPPRAESAPKQEPSIKKKPLEAGKIAVSVEPTIPATAGKPPEPPLAAPRKGRGRRSGMETALDSLPAFAAPYRAQIEEWLARREKSHRAKPEITSRTLAALEYANSKNVIEEVCDVLSERNWYSLGFTGYKEFIDRIAADKKKTNGSRLSPIAAKPETNGALCATITADPLASPHEEFFSIEHLADSENYIDL